MKTFDTQAERDYWEHADPKMISYSDVHRLLHVHQDALNHIDRVEAELAKYQTLFAKIDGFVKDGDKVVLRGSSEQWEGIVAGIGSMSGHGEKWDSLRDALAALVNLEIGHVIRFADEEGPACTTTSA